LEGIAMLKAVGSIVGALGKAGAAISSSNRLCSGASHCHTYPSSVTAMISSDSTGGFTSVVARPAEYSAPIALPLVATSDIDGGNVEVSEGGQLSKCEMGFGGAEAAPLRAGLLICCSNADCGGTRLSTGAPAGREKLPMMRSSKALRGADTEEENEDALRSGRETSETAAAGGGCTSTMGANVSDFCALRPGLAPGGRGGFMELRTAGERPGEVDSRARSACCMSPLDLCESREPDPRGEIAPADPLGDSFTG
jgi:hypothetical protein